MAFQPLEAPATPLGYHRILSPTAGVRVSPLCLGAMNFGDAWKQWMGECNKDTTFEILDYFYENGGNFIDTSNNYQNEESEQWIGDWMEARGSRAEIFLATKFTTGYKKATPGPKNPNKVQVNYCGNHTKSLHLSVEDSLKKLKTDYIDLLYIHWWDFSTSIEEVMQSLNHLVAQGKVLYLGISDTPAWVVSKANQYARDHGLRQFSVYQGKWSAAFRDFERDIIPMVRDEGMALAPWGALGGGKFKTEEQRKSITDGRKFGELSETDIAVSNALEKVAKAKNTIMTSVALAYVMHKTPYVFPIVGGRKIEHLKSNIEALDLELSDEDIKEIDSAAAFDVGFPMNFLFNDYANTGVNSTTKDNWLVKSTANLKTVSRFLPIKPSQK